jgi:hypothetical protein
LCAARSIGGWSSTVSRRGAAVRRATIVRTGTLVSSGPISTTTALASLTVSRATIPASAITSIVTCPINGIIETFSSSGSDITQMFQNPTNPVTILVQTALSDNGAPHQGKRAMRCSVSLNSNTLSTMNMTVDTENGSTSFPFQTGGLVTWVNNLNQEVQFQNNSLQDVFWFSTGFLYQRSKAAGTGVYLGLTLEGSFSGLIINGMVMEYQDGTTMASRTAA